MVYKLIELSKAPIDKNYFKLGDVLECEVHPQAISFGCNVEKIKKLNFIIHDFVTTNDGTYVPILSCLDINNIESNLLDTDILSWKKVGEIGNTHTLQPDSEYNHNYIVDIEKFKQWKEKIYNNGNEYKKNCEEYLERFNTKTTQQKNYNKIYEYFYINGVLNVKKLDDIPYSASRNSYYLYDGECLITDSGNMLLTGKPLQFYSMIESVHFDSHSEEELKRKINFERFEDGEVEIFSRNIKNIFKRNKKIYYVSFKRLRPLKKTKKTDKTIKIISSNFHFYMETNNE